MAEVAVTLLLSATLLPALLLWFSEGRVIVDSSGMRWEIKDDEGEIRWDLPFTVQRRRAVVSTTKAGDSGPTYDMDFPVVVYEISQVTPVIYRNDRLEVVYWLRDSPI